MILVLPVFGIVVYLLFGESRVAKKMTEESDAVVQEIENYFRENDKVREKIEALDEGISNNPLISEIMQSFRFIVILPPGIIRWERQCFWICWKI